MECIQKINTSSWESTETYTESSLWQWTPTILLTIGSSLRVIHFQPTYSFFKYFRLMIIVLMTAVLLFIISQDIPDAIKNMSVPTAATLWSSVVISTLAMELFESRITSQTLMPWVIMVLGITLQSHLHTMDKTDTTKTAMTDVLQSHAALLYILLILMRLVEVVLTTKNRPGLSIIHTEDEAISPQSRASLFSTVTFSWMTTLILKGYKTKLERDDLWTVAPENRSSSIIPNFEKYWNEQKYLSQRKKEQTNRTIKTDLKEPKPSLLVAILKTHAPILLHSAFFQLMFNISEFVCVTVLRWMIEITKNKEESSWKGYIYAFLMFGIALLKCFAMTHHMYRTQVAERRNWLALTGAIYKKTLRLSNASRKTTTVGEITNLVSVDAGKISECMWGINDVWAIPLVFFSSIYFLWQTIGSSIVCGIIIIIVFVPVNYVLTRKAEVLHEKQLNLKDSRIRVMNEVLNGIKVLKMYAWEKSFEKQILDIRQKELDIMKKYKDIRIVLHSIWANSHFLMSLATFGAFILWDSNNVLTAEKAFVCIYLFHNLHWSLDVLPDVINDFIQANVSLNRIQNFLTSEELDDSVLRRDLDNGYGISVESSDFYWDRNDDPVLKNINIQIPEGSLVAVVGSVGSGKSSLLSAMLGEMEAEKGKVNMKGSVAYVAQQAWIMNTTLQENILFGDDLNQAKYDKIINATALQKDLEMFPGGDQTEIGEKGINLSGGQKQRVSLARAVYQDADIYLLDDPLSAVDSHVGKHIFEKVIGSDGMLKCKTRILVTHGLRFLTKADIIITLSNGRIGEIGSFEDLMGHKGPFAEFLNTYMTNELIDAQEEIEALEMIEEEAHKHDNESLQKLRRQLSEITRKRTESEMSSSGNTIEITGEHTSITRSHSSKCPSLRSSRKPSDIDANDLSIDSHDSLHFITDTVNQDHNVFEEHKEKFLLHRQWSDISDMSGRIHFSRQTSCLTDAEEEKLTLGRLVEDEKEETGSVKLSVLLTYARAVGLKACLLIYVINIIHELAGVFAEVWLSQWTSDNETLLNGTAEATKNSMRFAVYGVVGLIRGIIIYITEAIVAYGLVRASKRLHVNLLHNILRSPMSFFDTTPLGRIVNRFSKDIDTIDDQIIYQFKDSVISLFMLCVTIFTIVTCMGTPQFLIVIIPIAVLYFFIQRMYSKTATQLGHMESAARSPVYAHFGETISGCSTIRAYQQQNRFMVESALRCDEVNTCHLLKISARKWLDIRTEALGSVVVLFACLFAVYERRNLSGGVAGLVIWYALDITNCLKWLVRTTSSVETNTVSVERIKTYSERPTEAEWVKEDHRPMKCWPNKGYIDIKGYGVRYREDTELVLKGISCKIKPGEKIGIVGRTGAGKSSLTMGLFRIIEKAEGSIVIDGIDISTIGLHDLRSKITIIPQDPVIFCGTIRMNLDPFDEYTNDAVWKALEHAHLKVFVNGLPNKLEFICSEGGENLSVGQRQLVCLGRALLRKTKILVLDEATAAVDFETDDLIQNTIRTEFSDCTVLTIAHRLNTIMDYNRILVLESGSIKEFDSPSTLLEDKSSAFYHMAKDAHLIAE